MKSMFSLGSTLTMVFCLAMLAAMARADDGQRPPGSPPGGPAGMSGMGGPGAAGGPPGGPGGMGHDRDDGRRDRDGRDDAQRHPGMAQFEMMRGYLEIVSRFSQLAKDPQASGVAAVIMASEILRPRGADAVVNYFTRILPETKDPAVAAAIRLQLAEIYKSSGQQDKALEQLQFLITGAPAPAAPRQP